jgi:hypothetical protein
MGRRPKRQREDRRRARGRGGVGARALSASGSRSSPWRPCLLARMPNPGTLGDNPPRRQGTGPCRSWTRIAAFHDEMAAWRRHLHQAPELGFEEHKTAAFVADKLKTTPGLPGRVSWGCSAPAPVGARSGCAPILTRCRSARRRACPGRREPRARCTLAATTGTRPCSLAPQSIWPRPAALTAPST